MELKKKIKQFTKEENEILLNNYKGKTYKQLLELFPDKTLRQLQSRCNYLKLDITKETHSWSESEIELLKILYPIKSNEDLANYFKKHTKKSIYSKAKDLNLEKSYNWRINNLFEVNKDKWNVADDNNLIELFNKHGEEYVYNYYKNKSNHTKIFIKNKLLLLNLISKPLVVKDKNNPSLVEIFKGYKKILNGDIDSFKNVAFPSKEQVIILFKYYLCKSNIEVTKDFLMNLNIGEILKESKLHNQVKAKFDGYIDFILCSFTKYNLKPWDFKSTGVLDNFWKNKINRVACVSDSINKLKSNNIIKNNIEILSLPLEYYSDYINKTLISEKGKECLIEYFEYHNIDVSKYNRNLYNNIRFDSIEERSVYKFIYENINYNINKIRRNQKYYNEKYNERYIPDFQINYFNKIIIIEYFGLFKENPKNKRALEYYNKTKRKIEYFKSLKDVIFIDLYPNDLKNNFQGVNDKLVPFIM